MMFPKSVARRLAFLDPNLCEQSDKVFAVVEKQESGQAELRVKLRRPAIQFKRTDNCQWKYLNNKNCADSIVFQYDNGKWTLHIFELKRTIKSDTWKTIRAQFDGAFLNALAMAGFLTIAISNIVLHSCFRKDKLQGASMEPAELRNALASRSVRDAIASWRRDDYTLQYCEGIPCEHKKKQLDENGFGTIELQVKILDLPT